VGRQIEQIRNDASTPDTRLADDPMANNPASVVSLIELALGGLHPGRSGSGLFCRLRYFDPGKQRAGLPDDVAALIDKLTADEVSVSLVNVSAIHPRRVIVQAGGYAEHRFTSVTIAGKTQPLDGAHVTVQLAPGAGQRMTFALKPYSQSPTLAMPWEL